MSAPVVIVYGGAYPVSVSIRLRENSPEIQFRHDELLALEFAVAEAKRQILKHLDRRWWHEVDPKLGCPSP